MARRSLVERLEPAERQGEVLFGLIMVLTFTLGAGLSVDEGPEGVRELLIAAIGCNLAWGIIDGAMYVMGRLSERGRRVRIARRIREAQASETALGIIRDELEDGLAPISSAEAREQLYADVREHVLRTPLPRNSLRSDDLLGGLASFWLVFLSAIPAALPFLFLSDPFVALRTSNALLVALLFAVGWRWGAHLGASPARTALSLTALGLLLVGVAMALGG